MRFSESYFKQNQHKYLPDFAQFLLDNYLAELARELVRLSYETDLPILKYLKQYPEEQLVQLTITSMQEYLGYLARNQASEQIEDSLIRWKKDQLAIIGKFELVAEDITLINYIRGRALRKFIPLYSSDREVSLQLVDELEGFLMASTTAATNTYIILLKEEIEKHEKGLLEAQAIARIGSFEWELETNKTKNSPQTYEIYEMEPGIGFGGFLQNVHPDDRSQVEEMYSKALKEGQFETEFRYQVNGKTKYIWSRGVVIKNKEGKPERVIGTIQDITSRKKAELELYEKTKALENSNASLEQFAFAASHDLKEPIRKVLYYADRLKTNLVSRMTQEEVELFGRMENATIRMRLLVEDLLEFSHVSMEPKELEEIDLNEKVRRVLDDLEILIREKNAEIIVGKLPVIKGHRRQIQQLFQNLIGNALKYSKPDVPPKVQISASMVNSSNIDLKLPAKDKDRKFHLIEVRDNGIGFEMEHAERIFQVFQRLHGADHVKGTGLGLSIARKVVENHNGYIKGEGEPDKGACFKIYLPVS